MNTSIKEIVNRMSGNLMGIVGILTTLVMACAAVVLAMDLAAHLSADVPAARAVVAEPAGGEFMSKTVVTLAMIFGLAIIAPFVGALSLFVLLKRYSRQMGPLIHIHYGGAAPSVVVGPFSARQAADAGVGLNAVAAAIERRRQREDLDVKATDLLTGESFDLGPSFEEEQHLKRSQANRLEGAVLAQLFAANHRLHEKIELDKVTQKEQEAVTETKH